MPTLIDKTAVIESAGNVPKKSRSMQGVNSGHTELSIARMTSPEGWVEPGQRPEFQEITVVLEGTLVVEHEKGAIEVNAGQAVAANPGEWVRHSTPKPWGAVYIAVCLPAHPKR